MEGQVDIDSLYNSGEYNFQETYPSSGGRLLPNRFSRETRMAIGGTTRVTSNINCHKFKPQWVNPYKWLEKKDEEYLWHNQMNNLFEYMAKNSVLVIHGPEGQGKNSLVSGYMRMAHNMEPKVYAKGLFWVNAHTKESIRSEFANLAKQIGISNSIPRNITGSVEDVCKWLHNNDLWLIVFYGANTTEAITELSLLCGKRVNKSHERCRIPSDRTNGHVIITSCLEPSIIGKYGFNNRYEIKRLDNGRVKKFILTKLFSNDKSKWSCYTNDEIEARALDHLVEMCGGLTIRAAWICAVFERQELVERSFHNMYQKLNVQTTPINNATEDFDTSIGILFIWLERMLRSKSPVCGLVLDLAAMCHTINIPLELFSNGIKGFGSTIQMIGTRFRRPLEQLLNGLIGKGESFLIQELKHGQNIGGLLHLQNVEGDRYVVHVHGAVQSRFQMINNPHRKDGLKFLTKICNNIFDKYSGNIKMRRQILPHAESCIGHLEQDLHCLIEDASMLDLYVNLTLEVATCYLIFFNLDAASRTVNRLSELIGQAVLQTNANCGTYQANVLYIKGLVNVWQSKENGIDMLKSAQQLFSKDESSRNDQKLCRTYTWIVFALIEMERLTEARKYLRLAEKLVDKFIADIKDDSDPRVYRIKAHIVCQRGKLYKYEAYKAVYMDCNIKGSMTLKRRKEYTKNIEMALQHFKEADEWGTKCEGEYRCDMYKVLACEMEGRICLEKKGNKSENFKSCVNIMRSYLFEVLADVGLYHRFTVRVKTKLAWMLLKLGDKEHLNEALRLIEEAIELQIAICESNSQPKMGELFFYKGQISLALGDRVDANECFEQARQIFTKHDKHIRLPRVLLMQVYAEQYDVDDVIRLFECNSLYNRMQGHRSRRRRHKSY